MSRSMSIVLVLLCLACGGCGTYRIRYTMPSKVPSGLESRKEHAHGLGLIGGGLYFFAVHQLFPAVVDYSGPIDVGSHCPDGFSEVSHYTTFGQNSAAGFLSWLTLVNVYHPSTIELHHAKKSD